MIPLVGWMAKGHLFFPRMFKLAVSILTSIFTRSYEFPLAIFLICLPWANNNNKNVSQSVITESFWIQWCKPPCVIMSLVIDIFTRGYQFIDTGRNYCLKKNYAWLKLPSFANRIVHFMDSGNGHFVQDRNILTLLMLATEYTGFGVNLLNARTLLKRICSKDVIKNRRLYCHTDEQCVPAKNTMDTQSSPWPRARYGTYFLGSKYDLCRACALAMLFKILILIKASFLRENHIAKSFSGKSNAFH